MMIPWRPSTPIGLDIGPRTIAAAQLRRSRSRWRIEAALIVPRPVGAGPVPDALELSRLRGALHRQGFSGRQVAVAAPDDRVISGTMELPPADSGAPLVQIARTELARMHRRELDSLESSAWQIPAPARAGHFSYMMAAGCPREDVERLLDALEEAGLVPIGMDIRAWAMARACDPLLSETPNVSAVLDLGEAEAVLSVVHQRCVVYERLMSDAGLAKLRRKLRNDLQLEDDIADHIFETAGMSGVAAGMTQEEGTLTSAAEIIREYFSGLVQELRTALAYAVHRYPNDIGRVVVLGAGACIPGLVEWIAEEVGAPVVVARPEAIAQAPEWLCSAAKDPALTTAMGLAIRTLEGKAA